jgi:FkbM family methyltransferase
MNLLSLDTILALTRRGLLPQFFRSLIWHIRSFVARFWNPKLDWHVGKIKCLVPLGHDLPFIWQDHPFYSAAIAHAAVFLAQQRHDFCAIDVGANIGDTALLVRNELGCPVLCVEADPGFFKILELNAASLPGVSCVHTLLAASDAVLSGRLKSGNSSSRFHRKPLGPTAQTSSLDQLLKTQPVFLNTAFLKIDTDGFELQVLRGAEALLRRAAPVLFLEFAPSLLASAGDNAVALIAFLCELGYGPALAYDHTGPLRAFVELGKTDLLKALTDWGGGNPDYYVDLCVFPVNRTVAAQEFFAQEQAFFKDSNRSR